jgi:hypothetical protein
VNNGWAFFRLYSYRHKCIYIYISAHIYIHTHIYICIHIYWSLLLGGEQWVGFLSAIFGISADDDDDVYLIESTTRGVTKSNTQKCRPKA